MRRPRRLACRARVAGCVLAWRAPEASGHLMKVRNRCADAPLVVELVDDDFALRPIHVLDAAVEVVALLRLQAAPARGRLHRAGLGSVLPRQLLRFLLVDLQAAGATATREERRCDGRGDEKPHGPGI